MEREYQALPPSLIQRPQTSDMTKDHRAAPAAIINIICLHAQSSYMTLLRTEENLCCNPNYAFNVYPLDITKDTAKVSSAKLVVAIDGIIVCCTWTMYNTQHRKTRKDQTKQRLVMRVYKRMQLTLAQKSTGLRQRCQS
jgi:hypothetical protein